MQFLMRYPFPGNIRELKNLLERVLLVSNNESSSMPKPSERNWRQHCLQKWYNSPLGELEKLEIQEGRWLCTKVTSAKWQRL